MRPQFSAKLQRYVMLLVLHRSWRSHMRNNASLLYFRTRRRSQLKRGSTVLHLRVHPPLRVSTYKKFPCRLALSPYLASACNVK